MADHTAIEWTDATWNPITGCSVVSPGCTNCYAMRLAGTRLAHHPSRAGLTRDTKAGPVWTGEVRLNEQWLTQPIGWRRPRMVFVCAHGDLFHESVPDEWIDRVLAVMALCPQHVFQVLTKRSARMRDYFKPGMRSAEERIGDIAYVMGARYQLATTARWPLLNVWLGVSAEDQRRADERIPDLLATPAAVRWVSAEPLLGPIDLERVGTMATVADAFPLEAARETRGRPLRGDGSISNMQVDAIGNAGSEITFFQTPDHMGGFTARSPRSRPRLDWIVVGGESGPGARPMHPDWARSLRDQCAASRVAFFFKQWGNWWPRIDRDKDDPDWRMDYGGKYSDSARGEYCWLNLAGGRGFHGERFHVMRDVGKKAAGRLLDGVEHNAMPAAQERRDG